MRPEKDGELQNILRQHLCTTVDKLPQRELQPIWFDPEFFKRNFREIEVTEIPDGRKALLYIDLDTSGSAVCWIRFDTGEYTELQPANSTPFPSALTVFEGYADKNVVGRMWKFTITDMLTKETGDSSPGLLSRIGNARLWVTIHTEFLRACSVSVSTCLYSPWALWYEKFTNPETNLLFVHTKSPLHALVPRHLWLHDGPRAYLLFRPRSTKGLNPRRTYEIMLKTREYSPVETSASGSKIALITAQSAKTGGDESVVECRWHPGSGRWIMVSVTTTRAADPSDVFESMRADQPMNYKTLKICTRVMALGNHLKAS